VTRSETMARIGSCDTGPEKAVRRLLWGMGFRFRCCRDGLPGRPDVVIPARRKAIFVHGCFWHAHGCRARILPRTRRAYWRAKFEGNRRRDRRVQAALRRLGWSVMVVWECALREPERVAARLRRFLA